MFLLDTNHCSRLIFGEPALLQRLEQHLDDGVATSTIVRGELLYMVQKSEQRTENLKAVTAFLATITQYPINSEVADAYGTLKSRILDRFGPKPRAQRRKTNMQNLGFGENDLWIAATAIAFQLTVVSSDQDFRRIQEAQDFPLTSWLDESSSN